MGLLEDIIDQGRRATVDLLHGGAIERDAPWSPEVPEDLREWLPDLFDRFPITLPWEHPKPIDPALDNVWILDNTAFRNMAGALNVEFVACYFIKNSGKNISKAVADIADHLGIAPDDQTTRKRIAHRLQPFADTVLPNRTLQVSVDQQMEKELGPSSQSGISSQVIELRLEPSSSQLSTSAVHLPPPFGLPSTTVIAEPEGWGIISDIDDTIKITQTPSPIGILKTTFVVERPEPVAGMPELYAHMQRTLKQPPFFYLSASPYNLYPFLRQFREDNYPQGTIILRDASWQNLGGLVASLSQGTQDYKADRITKIHSWFPQRKFVCLGDSTQTDPEAYAECARKFPGWIKAIFIRKVSGIAEMDEKKKNSPERFEKAFRGLDRGLWTVFTEPGGVAERIDALIG